MINGGICVIHCEDHPQWIKRPKELAKHEFKNIQWESIHVSSSVSIENICEKIRAKIAEGCIVWLLTDSRMGHINATQLLTEVRGQKLLELDKIAVLSLNREKVAARLGVEYIEKGNLQSLRQWLKKVSESESSPAA